MIKAKYEEFTKEFKELLIKSKSIGICVHINPDGDALGSMLGLYGGIRQLNQNVVCIQTDKTPNYLSFLPGIDELVPYSDDMKFDVLITLDSSSVDRIGTCQKLLRESKISVNIDHHVTNDFFADLNFVVSDASSTSEIVFNIIKELNINLNSNIATALYVGILTDTNRFLYKNSTSNTLKSAAELVDSGINKDLIHYNLYQVNTRGSFCLTGELIQNSRFYHDNKLALCIVNTEMLSKCDASLEDTEDKINILRDIEGVEVACLIKEESNDSFKVSLRSKTVVDVSTICAKFNGGGHVHAGGFSFTGEINNLQKTLLEVLDDIEWDKI